MRLPAASQASRRVPPATRFSGAPGLLGAVLVVLLNFLEGAQDPGSGLGEGLHPRVVSLRDILRRSWITSSSCPGSRSVWWRGRSRGTAAGLHAPRLLTLIICQRYRYSIYCTANALAGGGLTFRDLELGAIRAHVLHHASRSPVYGSWMAGELVRHGYEVSYGTLYPMLHRMEKDGLLLREDRVEGGRVRKYYTATQRGLEELERARQVIRELYREVVEGEGPDPED
jgi:DNA-binding PadR family transcriptional regulator